MGNGAGGCAFAAGSTAFTTPAQNCITERTVVVSLANDDFRVEDCVTANRRLSARWNVRQAGSNIRNCGPGTLPDGDGARCSWNWNFNQFDVTDVLGVTSTETEAEAFFGRSSPRSFEPWQLGAAQHRSEQEEHTNSLSNVMAVELTALGIPSQTASKEKKSIMSGHVTQTTALPLLVSTHGLPQRQQPSSR